MCMEYDEKATQRLRKKMERNGGKLLCWKTWFVKGRELHSPHFAHKRGGQVGAAGVIRSDRLSTKPDPLEESSRFEGIHVFRTKKAARTWRLRVTVPVTCLLRDLVGAGWNCGCVDEPSALFTKVRLLKKDFAAAMKGA